MMAVSGAGNERPARMFGQFVGDDDAFLTGAGQGCNEAAVAGAHIVDADHIAIGLQALAEEFLDEPIVVLCLDDR